MFENFILEAGDFSKTVFKLSGTGHTQQPFTRVIENGKQKNGKVKVQYFHVNSFNKYMTINK